MVPIGGAFMVTADAILLLPRVWCDESVDDRPWADVHPSMNWLSYPEVDAGDGKSDGSVV